MVEGLTLHQASLAIPRPPLPTRPAVVASTLARSSVRRCHRTPTLIATPRGLRGLRCVPGRADGLEAVPCGILTLAEASRDGAAVARRAHNPKVGGSNPSPATKSANGRSACSARLASSARPHRTQPDNHQPRDPPPCDPPAETGNWSPWWLERGGTTRSHPEHGSETPQRRRYSPGNRARKIGHRQNPPRDACRPALSRGRPTSLQIAGGRCERAGDADRRLPGDRLRLAVDDLGRSGARSRDRALTPDSPSVRSGDRVV